ncbi:hypothetical protein HWV62_38604 [Athelia sp. TMB]|nr:hypothetical protein HWV62_17690 [Athelia sp. TMB]KAF7986191.1 hypothetical protein HWV62_38604 [Athelia sp. TMB]
MAAISSRRLAKELREINADGCPVGINLVSADSFEKWLFSLEVMGESEYSLDLNVRLGPQGQVFTLMFRFTPQYPIDSPAVQFLVDQTHVAPIHPVRLLCLRLARD